LLLGGCRDLGALVQCADDADCGPGSVCTNDGLCLSQDTEGDEAGECSDGVDNDQDGTTDCDDEGCATATDCAGDDDDDAGDEDDAGDDDTGDDDTGDDDAGDDDTGDDDAGDDDDDTGDDDDDAGDDDTDDDDTDDGDGPLGWNGEWDTTPPVVYSCANTPPPASFPMVSIDFSQLLIAHDTETIHFTAVGATQPGTMSGSLSGDSVPTTFSVSVLIPGSCDETYSLTGVFTGPNEFTASFTASFTAQGSTGDCLDCANQFVMITGTR